MIINSRKKIPKPTWPFPTGKPTQADIERQKLRDEEDAVINQDAEQLDLDLNDVPTTEEAYASYDAYTNDDEVIRRTTRDLDVDHNWIETGYD